MSDDSGANKLAPCPKKPNCVSSRAKGRQWIEPLANGETQWQRLPAVLGEMPGIRIVAREADYIHAEAKTPLLRFVDDLEFQYSPEESVIHMRSASRLGYSDFGTNRKRLESIRERLEEKN